MQELFSNIKAIFNQYNIISLQRNISVIEKLLASDKIIDIAIMGQFKAGKSSFINNLLGSPILPTGVVPVTSVITRIAFGETEKAIVLFEDGRDIEIKLNELKDYVEEAKNPENFKNVAIVDVFLPELERYKGIRFVDTPGMGSYYKHNTETTANWSPEIGVSLLAISSERPLSENEVELIKDLLNYTPRIILLLTKTDLFSDSQLSEISSYILQSLNKEFNKNFEIYYYSTKKNNEYHKNQIIEKVINPLYNQLDKTYQDIIAHKINNLKSQCIGYLELAYQSALKNEKEKEEIKKLILDEKTNLDYLFREVRLICNNYTSQTREGIASILQKFQKSITEELTNSFYNMTNQWKGNLNKQTKTFESWIANTLRTKLYIIADDNHYKLIEILQKAKRHFSIFIKNFQERINQNIKNVLGIELQSEEFEIDINQINQPDIRINRTFDFTLDVFWFLFPMFIFKNIFHKHFKKQIPSLVETNIHRLISDYTEKINKEILNLERKSINLIKDEYYTIESTLNIKQNDAENIFYAINLLKNGKNFE